MNANRVQATLQGTRILVTGAAGFIGRHLCTALADLGARVFALRRPASSATAWDDRLEWCEADVADKEAIAAVIRHAAPQRVIHLAARTSVERGFHPSEAMIATNLQGTINLLQALEGIDYACFVQTGTAEEYGAGTAPFRESAPLKPVSAYSASKAAATLFSEMYHRTLGCPIVILRPFLVYGPGQPPDKLIPQAILAALTHRDFPMTTGEQTREFTYIDDIVKGYLQAVTTPGAVGHTINLGTGETHRVIDVVRQIMQLTGSRMTLKIGAIPTRPGEIWTYQCDNTKARKILGWKPAVSLSEGLRKTIGWYRQAVERGEVSP